MADSIDRAINFILSLKTDQYTSALSAVSKTTDDAMGAVNNSLGKVQTSMDAVTASTQKTSVSMSDVAKTATDAGAGLDAAAQGTAATSQAMAALDTATKAAGTDLGSVATAATNTAKATESSSTAMKSAADSASALGKSTTEAAKATETSAASISKASTSIGQAGQSANTAGGFFQTLLGRATSLVPGLGSLVTIAGGVATGFAGMQIAEKVGNWLLDVGTKAIAGSAALKSINDTVSKAQEAFQQAAGKGIETLATAITQLLGPSLEKLIGWVTEGLKWVTAFGDWFQKSGIVTQIAQSFFDRLSAGFGGTGNSAKSGIAVVLDSLGLLSTKLDANGQRVIDWAGVWQKTLKGVMENVVTFLALIDYVGTKIQDVLNTINDAFAKAGETVHNWIVAASKWVYDLFPDSAKKALSDLGTAIGDTFKKANDSLKDTPAATKAAADGLEAYRQKWAGILGAWGQGIADQKKLNDAHKDTTAAIGGQADAEQQLWTEHHRSFADGYREWLQWLKLQQDINTAVQAFIPTYQEADKVWKAVGDDAVASLNRTTQAMQSLKFETDKQIDDMVYNVKVGWEKQVELAGTSTQEIMRLNKAAWDQIVTIVQTRWQYMNAAQKEAIAQAGAEIQKSADQYGQVLRDTTKTTQTETQKQSEFWQQCTRVWDHAVKQAASSMADTLWSGKNSFGETMKSLLTDIGKMFTQVFIETGLKAIQKFITEGNSGLTDFFGNIKKGLGGLFSGGGGTSAPIPSGDGGGGGSGGGAFGSVGGAINVVSGAISAISGVIQNFQLKGLTKVDENIQNGVFLTYYAAANLYTEFVSFFHTFMNNWRNVAYAFYGTVTNALQGIVARWDQAGFSQLFGYVVGIVSRIDREIIPRLQAIVGGGIASVSSINLQPMIDAFQSALTSLQSSLGNLSVGNLSIDLTPLVTVMSQVRDALSQGALRPNVTITVSTGVTTQEVSREIVYQLQMAGVIR